MAMVYGITDEDTGLRVYSYPDVGWLFGRDHTSVISGIRSHNARIKAAKKIARLKATSRSMGAQPTRRAA